MSNDSPQIQAIRERFRNSFGEKKAAVDASISNLERLKLQDSREGMKNELEVSHGELHKLAGSFGMYGYNDLSDVCRASMKAISKGSTQEAIILLNKLSGLLSEFTDKDRLVDDEASQGNEA